MGGGGRPVPQEPDRPAGGPARMTRSLTRPGICSVTTATGGGGGGGGQGSARAALRVARGRPSRPRGDSRLCLGASVLLGFRVKISQSRRVRISCQNWGSEFQHDCVASWRAGAPSMPEGRCSQSDDLLAVMSSKADPWSPDSCGGLTPGCQGASGPAGPGQSRSACSPQGGWL